jgi:uncharacterized membrane protein YoaK (UPF0700 family)
MFSKLPPWIWIGASLLAFVAGIVNAIGFLGVGHIGLSHLTGTTTLFGVSLARGNISDTLHFLFVILSFVVGASASGFIIRDSALRLGRRYGVALMIESGLLIGAVLLLRRQIAAGDYLASSACGLQNAMASTYSGATLRTTHMTGALTDAGIFFGHFVRGIPVDWRRFRLLLALIGSFAAGGFVGGLFFSWWSYDTLLVPALLTGCAGMAYSFYRKSKI